MPTKTNSTPEAGAKSLAERFDTEQAKATISEAARRAERVFQDSIETLRSQSRVYVDAAGEQFGSAQRYVTERVKERPMTATMAGVGVGLLLGLLLAGSRNRRH